MKPFKNLHSKPALISQVNVDTDQIVPARYLRKPRSDDFGEYLFHDVPQLLDGAANADVLVAGRNFGCGSSREHAVWALYDYGFRTVIAPSFGDIFYSNALKNGLLPIVLPEDVVLQLLSSSLPVKVDLENQKVNDQYHFDIAPFAKKCLLEGLDEIDYTLSLSDKIAQFEKSHPQ